jgi:hypothetical protein
MTRCTEMKTITYSHRLFLTISKPRVGANCKCSKNELKIGVFRVDLLVVIQLPFHGVIQIMNLGAKNVGNMKQP